MLRGSHVISDARQWDGELLLPQQQLLLAALKFSFGPRRSGLCTSNPPGLRYSLAPDLTKL